MALLGDLMFDAQTRAYVTEELDGRLEVRVGYDSIDVTLAGRASDFERLMELMRNAFLNLQLTPEAVERARAERLRAVATSARTPAEVADAAAAARLFGAYPYGRSAEGTPESLARAQRPDLMLMRERFLNPNNATLVIAGDLDQRRVMRLLRQSLGPWRKGDRTIPATFRQPEAPDARALVINRPGASGVEVRLAARGLARADRDYPYAQALAQVALSRWLAAVPELSSGAASARHRAFREGGLFLMSATVPTPELAARALAKGREVLSALASSQPPTAAEMSAGTAAAPAAQAQGVEALIESWLDEQTYGLTADSSAPVVLSAGEAQRVAARLFLHTPLAAVAVGDAERLRAELARAGGVEVFGEPAAQPAAATTQPPQASPSPQTQPAQAPIRLKRP